MAALCGLSTAVVVKYLGRAMLVYPMMGTAPPVSIWGSSVGVVTETSVASVMAMLSPTPVMK